MGLADMQRVFFLQVLLLRAYSRPTMLMSLALCGPEAQECCVHASRVRATPHLLHVGQSFRSCRAVMLKVRPCAIYPPPPPVVQALVTSANLVGKPVIVTRWVLCTCTPGPRIEV
jgi:hypothetical protein